ncbi:hypothetical protein [Phycicoccus avicenniae]|uniref:recombination directionality factor n=1 Tax=Phycicoccus avicenniae TaxID=2828860 RepID=UPI003D2D8EBE
MPIITTQRRMAEHGRIRLGQKVTGTSRAGKEYTRPSKLDRFRFTSPNQGLIEQIAQRYGGTAAPWDNAGKAEHEVVSDARSIPVIVVKGGFSQWHEFWTAGGCKHRCDGEKDPTGAYCDPDDPNHIAAIDKPTTRLSVMLSEIESLGVWRMESKGWNAAAELPSMAELAMHVGDLVPATLSLAERSSIIETQKGPQTSRFVVPVLDLHVTKARLVELVGGPNGAPQIGAAPAGGAAQIEAAPAVPDYGDDIAACTTVDEVSSLWRQIAASGHLYDHVRAALIARGDALQPAAEPEPQPNDDGTYDAEEVPDEDASGVWMQVLAEAGEHGWTSNALVSAFEQWAAIPVSDGSGAQYQEFLAALRRGEVGTEGAA